MSIGQTASQLFEEDIQFRRTVQSVVARIMLDPDNRLDPDNIRLKDVHEIATRAATVVLKEAFDGDAEIQALRFERDHYKEAALRGFELSAVRAIKIVDRQE